MSAVTQRRAGSVWFSLAGPLVGRPRGDCGVLHGICGARLVHSARGAASSISDFHLRLARQKWMPTHTLSTSLFGPSAASSSQRRGHYWDADARRGLRDKPAISGPTNVYVKGSVPVVLREAVRGVGKKGQIVTVKRGYARHFLVPQGLGVFGTWENIDVFADPELVEDSLLHGQVAEQRGRLPFDWVGEIRLRVVRRARDDDATFLVEPVTRWDVLHELSQHHELDLLPANLELPEVGIETVGLHTVPVRLAFRSPEVAAGRYTLEVSIVSAQSLVDEERRLQMARDVQQSQKFELPAARATAVLADSDSDSSVDEGSSDEE